MNAEKVSSSSQLSSESDVEESKSLRHGLALRSQIIRTFLFEMAMSITFKTSDSLSRLGLLPFSLFEVLLLLSRTCEFPFITKFPTVLELQKFT